MILIDEIFTSDINNVNYKILLIVKNKKTKKLKIKRKYKIITIRNKQLQISIKNKKLTLFLRRKRVRKTFENNFDQFKFFLNSYLKQKILNSKSNVYFSFLN